MNNIKMVVLDIDGTIMNKQFQISDRMRETISKAIDSGIHVVLATGRMYSATVPIAQGLGLRTPVICYQGSLVREFYNSDDILIHYTIPPAVSKLVIDELRNFDVQVNFYIDDEMFIEAETPMASEYAERRHIVFHKVSAFEKILEIEPTKILAMDIDPEKITIIRDHLRKKFSNALNITKSTPNFCEFVNIKASKGNAILHLAGMWGINQSEIMVIGDQDNDIDMFEIAGFSVAMGNGTEEIKKIAHYITDKVENDGAALAIEKFVLKC